MGEFDTDEFIPAMSCTNCGDNGHRNDECLVTENGE